ISRVEYRVVHNGTRGIKDVYIYVHREDQLPPIGSKVRIEIEVTFNTKQDHGIRVRDDLVLRSGNPGYLEGKPVLLKNGDNVRSLKAPFGDCSKFDAPENDVNFNENLQTACVYSSCREARENLFTLLTGDPSSYLGAVGS